MALEIEGVREFTKTLNAAQRDILPEVTATMVRGVNEIKRSWIRGTLASEHFGQASSSITYDDLSAGYLVSFEVGPEKGAPGSVMNIAQFGSSRAGGGTVPEPEAFWESELPVLERYLLEAVVRGFE